MSWFGNLASQGNGRQLKLFSFTRKATPTKCPTSDQSLYYQPSINCSAEFSHQNSHRSRKTINGSQRNRRGSCPVFEESKSTRSSFRPWSTMLREIRLVSPSPGSISRMRLAPFHTHFCRNYSAAFRFQHVSARS